VRGVDTAANVIVSIDNSRQMRPADLTALKSLLKSGWEPGQIPTASIRLAYQNFQTCLQSRGIGQATEINPGGGCLEPLHLRWLDEPARDAFLKWVDALNVTDLPPTPSLLFQEAGRLLQRGGKDGAFAADPGRTEQPLLFCRRSFHIYLGMDEQALSWSVGSSSHHQLDELSSASEARARTTTDGEAQRPFDAQGRLISAASVADWNALLSDIVAPARLDPIEVRAGSVSNTEYLTPGLSRVFRASYEPAYWVGHLRAHDIDSSGQAQELPLWDAAAKLDARDLNLSPRKIWSFNGQHGIPWQWESLPNAAQDTLKGGADQADAQGRELLAYVAGLSGAGSDASRRWRQRRSLLGDIVNSKPWWAGDPKSKSSGVVYVGSNAGMLHGFSADSGEELLAYIPQGVVQDLRPWAATAAAHRFLVDASPFVGQFHDGHGFRSALVGRLGLGGRGYFVLDVTQPGAGPDPRSGVMLDRTNGQDPDIGYQIGEPAVDPAQPGRSVQITALNDGRWALLMGNGLNSPQERAVLLIQYLDGARELLRIPVEKTLGGANGLMVPQPIDLNGDGRADVAYAADMHGRLWKFDLTAAQPIDWKVAFDGEPLLTARNAHGRAQTIVQAPAWLPHPLGGLMLSFATGREFTAGDIRSQSIESIYGVWDDTPLSLDAGRVVLGTGHPLPTHWRTEPVSPLIEQTRRVAASADGRAFFTGSRHPVRYLGESPARGWFIDLFPADQTIVGTPAIPRKPEPLSGGGLEKALMPGVTAGRFLWLRTQVRPHPQRAKESCEIARIEPRGVDYFVDMFTGTPGAKPSVGAQAAVSLPDLPPDLIAWSALDLMDPLLRLDATRWLASGRGESMRIELSNGYPARLGWRRLR
jgi:type IV pilus assembly protein PilY1